MRRLLHAVLFLAAFPGSAAAVPAADGIRWEAFSEAVFERAQREGRYVLLHMAAVWCHWCHVMEDTTYRDPAVRALIEARFIPVRVDQDSRPDLSYRYERYGWPATIMFDGAGNEIFKRRGYYGPELFARLLQAVLDDPSALPATEPEIDTSDGRTVLSRAQREALEGVFRDIHDARHGGFGEVHRYLQAEPMEYALRRGIDAPEWRRMATLTLDGALALIDPVWGGMYQYSDKLDWSSPHYEKIALVQMAALKSYALAYSATDEARYLEGARAIHRFLAGFLAAPGGGFYASHDADVSRSVTGKDYFRLGDADRRALGLPRRDENRYARENGWYATGLAALYDVSGDAAALADARAAAEWALAARRTPDGGFGHGAAAETDAYLADNVAMAEAFLALYRSTAERRWLALALEAAAYMERHYRAADGGFMAQEPPAAARGVLRRPVLQFDENVAAVRLFNLLDRYTGEARWRGLAEHGMRWLAAHADFEVFLPGLLLADDEMRRAPVHLTVVGGKDDPEAARLYAAARRHPDRYLRIEWWDRREGPLPNPDVRYPELERAAAFACADRLCSLPAFQPDELAEAIRQVASR